MSKYVIEAEGISEDTKSSWVFRLNSWINERPPILRALLSFFMVVFFWFGLVFAYVGVGAAAAKVTGDAAWGVVVSGVVIFSCVVVWRRKRYVPLNDVSQHRWPSRGVLAVVVAFGCAWVVGQLVGQWTLREVGSEGFEQYQQTMMSNPLVMLLAALVVAPLSEEALLRGFFYPVLRRSFRPLWAAVITSLVFGVMHANIVQFVAVIPLAVVLAFVYERTERLWPVVVLHMVNNMLATFVPTKWITSIASVGVIAMLVPFMVVSLYWLYRVATTWLEPVPSDHSGGSSRGFWSRGGRREGSVSVAELTDRIELESGSTVGGGSVRRRLDSSNMLRSR